MQAIHYSAFGPASDVLTLGQMTRPDPAPGEVLVRLHRSGVNPSDVKARAGSRPGITKPPFERVIPHSDGAGVIEAVGAGVDPARINSRVWIWNGQWQRAFGTAADYIALPADQAVPLPDDISFDTGATLGIPGLTASHAVFGGGDVTGQRLLVSGGGGTVGFLAVQLAKWGGATVIATASPRDFDRLRSAGADHVLDYHSPQLAQDILAVTGGAPIDRAVEPEFGVNIQMLSEVMGVNTTIAAYGSALDMSPVLPFGPLLFKAVTIDIVLVYLLDPVARAAAIARMMPALTGGALISPIHKVYALADCAEAHRAVEAGGRSGAILISLT